MHGNVKDLTGQRFGNLTVLELTDLKLESRRGTVWKCRCDCGNICYKTSTNLQDKRRLTTSCGCMQKNPKWHFGNKFVPNKTMSKEIKIKNEFAIEILKYFEDASFYNELLKGINNILNKED